MAQVIYKIHNLVIASEVPILGAKPSKTSRKIDVRIREIKKRPHEKCFHSTKGGDCFQSGSNYSVWFRRVYNSLEKSGIVTHEILPLVLAAKGLFLLHGSVIQNKKKTFLVLGKSGSGKSTLSLEAIKNNGFCGGDEASIVYKNKNRWYVTSAFSTLRHWGREQKETKIFGKNLIVLDTPLKQRPLDKVIVLKKKSRKSKLNIRRASGVSLLQELLTHLFWPDRMEPVKRRRLFEELSEFSLNLSPWIVDYPHDSKSQTLVLQELLEFKKIS